MNRSIKHFIQQRVANSPLESFARKAYTQFSRSRGAAYDRELSKVLRKALQPTSNCIDAGCYRGTVLRDMLKFAPRGAHFAFEPTPENFVYLNTSIKNAKIYNVALSDYSGKSTFQHVVSMPARSGFLKVEYPEHDEIIDEIIVNVDTLDNIIPYNLRIDLIKIDVEGAELAVIRGGQRIIKEYRPIIIFEYGMPKAEFYQEEPEQIYTLLTGEYGYQISLMERWLKGEHGLGGEEFSTLVRNRLEFNFMAYVEAVLPRLGTL